MICSCCGADREGFDSYRGRINAVCPVCGALERHRLIWLYLEQEMGIYDSKLRVLHCSPQEILYKNLKELENLYYVPINVSGWPPDINLEEVPFQDNFFDVVIASHVLEHVENDSKALMEIFRVLRPQGCAILLVPISGSVTEIPCPGAHGVIPRTLRIYGLDDFSRQLKRTGFSVEIVDWYKKYGAEYGLHPSDLIFVGRKGNDNGSNTLS